MPKARLSDYILEFSKRNKSGASYPVYSVTNSTGFCIDYFGKDVSSKDKTNYKIVPKGHFAYNPSRVNVGSIDYLRDEDAVIVSPLYVVFGCKEGLLPQYLLYALKSGYGRHLISSSTTGSVRANLKFSTLSSFKINIPSLEVQRRIVHEIDTTSQEARRLKDAISLLDETVKSLFNKRRVRA